ncbi:MAG: putative addiction module antidote protein [Chlamydiales bacterium]
MRKTKKYKEDLLEDLQDPEEAAEYLNAAMQDDDPQVFLLAIRDVVEAQGGMSWLADRSKLNRESLYRTLSARGNPRLTSLRAVLNAFGLGLSVTKKQRAHR